MTVFLFGSGVLGRYLFDYLSPSNDVCIVPGRSQDKLERSLDILGSDDFVIDLLDPASFPSLAPDIIHKVASTRERLIANIVSKYIYVSSSSVYQPSTELLNESSTTFNMGSISDGYTRHKLRNEQLVSNACSSPYIIARIPNLWSSQLSENKGFFLDLFQSYYSSSQLPERQGDEYVFSFMSYSHAAFLLGSLLFSDLHGLVNLPSKTYSSRLALKIRQNPPDLPATGRILTTHREFDFDLYSRTMEDSWVYW